MFKFNQNEKYKTIAIYAALVIVISALIIIAVLNYEHVFSTARKIASVLSPFTYGFIIAYLCNPMLNFYERTILSFKKSKRDLHKLRRALSLILTAISALAIIGVLAYAVIPQTVKSINDFAGHFNVYFANLQKIADELTAKYSHIFFETDYSSIAELLSDHDISVDLKDLLSNTVSLFSQSLDSIVAAGSRFVGEILNILMAIFIAFYFLASKEKICAQAKKLLAALLSRRAYLNTIRLARYTHKTFGGFIVGKIIDSAIIGVLSFIVLWIFKMPYYPLLAVIIGVTNVIPTFGPFVGGIIGSVIVLIASPEDLILFIIFVFLIQQLDGNVIGPKILGDSIGIGALWVIIAIVLCGGFFGFGGMVIGVPLVAVIYALVKQSSERRLARKNMPQSTEFYKTDPPFETDIDPEHIFIDRTTEIPDITAADDVEEKVKVKKPTLTEKIKNHISSKKSKGNKNK